LISPHAIIDPSAKIAKDVTIGPFAIIEANVEIGSGTQIGPNAYIKGPTRIGKDNKIYQFSSLGEDPQDEKYKGEATYLEIGDRNLIREFCTINRGTPKDIGVTRIGNDNLIMSYVHIAHDCQIGNHIVFANNVTLAGHVIVDDHVVMGGFAAIYQFCRLATQSFIAAGSLVEKDVPPYIRVAGSYAKPYGLNSIGLRRHGFSKETMASLKQAYRIIYRQNLTAQEAIEALHPLTETCSEINLFIEVLQQAKHGITR